MEHVLGGILRTGDAQPLHRGRKGGPWDSWSCGYTGSRAPAGCGGGQAWLRASFGDMQSQFQVRVCVLQESSGARMLCCSNAKAWEVFFPQLCSVRLQFSVVTPLPPTAVALCLLFQSCPSSQCLPCCAHPLSTLPSCRVLLLPAHEVMCILLFPFCF